MAEQGVLAVPPKLIDAQRRNTFFLTSEASVVAYNKKLISEDKVPNQWQDFLKPEFKGRKFITDIRPLALADDTERVILQGQHIAEAEDRLVE